MGYILDPDSFDALPAREGRGFHAAIFAQQIVSLKTGLLARFEVLARLNDERLSGEGTIEQMYAALEKTDAIIDHDLDVFRHAHRALATLAARMPVSALPTLSVNFSPRTLSSNAFSQTLESIALQDPRLMRKMVLEVTERYDFDDVRKARDNLTRARELGMEISQDDVPKGQCAALRHTETRHLVSTIKLVGDGMMSLRSVAGAVFNPGAYQKVLEMIETAEDMTKARAAGIDFGQGYFFGRPVPLSEALNGWGDLVR